MLMEAEMGRMQLQTQESQGLPINYQKLEEGRMDGFSCYRGEGNLPLLTDALILDLYPSEL